MIYTRETKTGKVYGVRFRINMGSETVQKNLSPFKTKAEAKQAEFEFRQSALTPKKVADTTPTDTTRYIDVWEKYKVWALNNLAPATYYTYVRINSNQILPTFSTSRIKAIDRVAISNWQDKLSANFTAKYKRQIRNVLSAVMTYAKNKGFIDTNPVSQTEQIRGKASSKMIDFWTKAEFDKFIAVVDSPLYKAFFSFLYASGCRKGEGFALRWADCDFVQNTVSISKGLTKKGQLLTKKLGKSIVEKTKNGKSAVITMPSTVMALIKSLPKGEYVFGGDNPIAETTLTRVFNNYIEKAEVKKIRIHDLRHSCASLIISSSTSELTTLYAVANRLRDTPEMILKTYGHLFPSRQAEVTKFLDKQFENLV